MTFKITYTEGDTINKTCEIEAEGKAKATTLFWVEHPEASDISKVEKLQDAENENN